MMMMARIRQRIGARVLCCFMGVTGRESCAVQARRLAVCKMMESRNGQHFLRLRHGGSDKVLSDDMLRQGVAVNTFKNAGVNYSLRKLG